MLVEQPFHPFAACLMFRACQNGNTVDANLKPWIELREKVKQAERERDEARDLLECHLCAMDVSPPVTEDDAPEVYCGPCARTEAAELKAAKAALAERDEAVRLRRESDSYAEKMIKDRREWARRCRELDALLERVRTLLDALFPAGIPSNVRDEIDALLLRREAGGGSRTGTEDDSRLVTVCDACLTASCWKGKILCARAKDAGTVALPVATLRAKAMEHPDYWKEDS